jgi:ABC-type branched-subunit amino acid transport system ATPase component/branched-subunit amino acid ABC-type transport system permease component
VTEVIRFGVLGLGTGALYALAALGVVLVYRGSGVVNFAQGAIGIAGAYLFYELHILRHTPLAIAFVLGVAFSALLGVLTQLVVMRPLRHASSLVRLVATLGILIALQAAAVLRYGADSTFVPSSLPDNVLHITDKLTVSVDRLYLIGIATALTGLLYVVYRKTTFGLATTAVAENQRASSALGWSPDVIATINWALGAGLGGVAAILIVPIVSLQVGVLTTITMYALAVALIAGFRSFPITLAAGLGVGVLQAWIIRYKSDTVGLAESLPFLLILLVLVLRGKALPLRGTLLDRLPAVSSGRIRISRMGLPLIIVVGLIVKLQAPWVSAITTSLIMSILLLSIVVLTGYAGQLSLGQYALAGLGAYVCGRLDAGAGWPLPIAFVIALLCAIPFGLVFGLPALRTRGLNLAILTLGLGVAIGAMIFNNLALTGDFGYDTISEISIFGWNMSAAKHPERYALLVLAWFVVVAIMVSNIRRGRVGRRLLAIRTNERAAAALGISVLEGKLFAFVFATGVASLAGILMAYQSTSLLYSRYAGSFDSINAVALSVIGGLGYITGPLFGSMLVPGGLGARIGKVVFSDGFTTYLPLIGGLAFIAVLLQDPNGLAESHIKLAHRIGSLPDRIRQRQRVARPARRRTPVSASVERDPNDVADRRVAPGLLQVEGLTVRYGGVVAVDNVSFQLRTGSVMGLIGPNGAGKTTVIDALTGFVKPTNGQLSFNDRSLNRMSAAGRARAGLSRSFQSLELFDDMTVAENLLAASEPRDRLGYLTGLLHPGRARLSAAVIDAVTEFDLLADLDKPVKDLSYAQRRLVAIVRAVATGPSILLLDEPAAGLSDHESMELATVVRRLVEQTGVSVLLVEHDMQFVMGLCDNIVVLDFGRTIANGPPHEVRNDVAVIAAYLGEAPHQDDPATPSADLVSS